MTDEERIEKLRKWSRKLKRYQEPPTKNKPKWQPCYIRVFGVRITNDKGKSEWKNPGNAKLALRCLLDSHGSFSHAQYPRAGGNIREWYDNQRAFMKMIMTTDVQVVEKNAEPGIYPIEIVLL